jgi:hypothetical protein
VYENAGRKGKELGMKKFFLGMVLAGFALVSVTVLNAGTVNNQGKAWLDAQTDPPAINVSGRWDSDFGVLSLDQATTSRDVSGSGGGYQLTGVVSGKRLFLLFASNSGTVDYCATLSYENGNSLTGSYSDRQTRLRFGHSLCQERSKKMYMRRK